MIELDGGALLLSPARLRQASVMGLAWHPVWASTLTTQSMSWILDQGSWTDSSEH